MSTFAERKTIAQHIANVTVVFDVQPDPSTNRATHSGTLFGLTLGALAIGLTYRQIHAIQGAASDWSAENCPGLKGGPAACISCPNACNYVPLEPEHWR